MIQTPDMLQVIDFVKKHVGSDIPLLAGNSVYVDLLFLKVSKSVIICLVSCLFDDAYVQC